MFSGVKDFMRGRFETVQNDEFYSLNSIFKTDPPTNATVLGGKEGVVIAMPDVPNSKVFIEKIASDLAAETLQKYPIYFVVFKKYHRFLSIQPALDCDLVSAFAARIHDAVTSSAQDVEDILQKSAQRVRFLGHPSMDFSGFEHMDPDLVALFHKKLEAAGTSWAALNRTGDQTLWGVLRKFGITRAAQLVSGEWKSAFSDKRKVQEVSRNWFGRFVCEAVKTFLGYVGASIFSVGALVMALINLFLDALRWVEWAQEYIMVAIAVCISLVAFLLPAVFVSGGVGAWALPYFNSLLLVTFFSPSAIKGLYLYCTGHSSSKLGPLQSIVDAVTQTPLRHIPNVIKKLLCIAAPLFSFGLIKCEQRGTVVHRSEVDNVSQDDVKKFMSDYMNTDSFATALEQLAKLQFFINNIDTARYERLLSTKAPNSLSDRPVERGGRSRSCLRTGRLRRSSRHARLGLRQHRSLKRSRRSRHVLVSNGTRSRSRSSRFRVRVSGGVKDDHHTRPIHLS
jgi:hypothetical protein